MTDPIQASSSNPLPTYQTLKGAQDPLPVSSPRALDKSAAARTAEDAMKQADDFKGYLDKTSVTVVEKAKPRHEADPVDLIAQGSVYAQPGVTQAF